MGALAKNIYLKLAPNGPLNNREVLFSVGWRGICILTPQF